MTIDQISQLASDGLLHTVQYSKEWCYWRGVAVTVEAIRASSRVDEEWLKSLARLAKESE